MLSISSVRSTLVAALVALSLIAAPSAQGQSLPISMDSVRERVTLVPTLRADSLLSPLSPRRAFLYSVLLPGYSQTVLGRPKAASIFLFVEALSIAMIRQSGAEIQEARRTANDTIVITYVDPSGNPLSRPIANPWVFNDTLVHSRRAHLEDWIALLVANHLFSGADAYVAANLWDVPARLGFRMLPGRRAMLKATITW